MTGGLDYYHILDIPRDATPEEIRAAYFELARQYHPDANPDPAAREHFLIIQDAYSVLSNPERRTEYELRLPPPPAPPEISINLQYSRTVIPRMDEPQLVYALAELTSTSEADRSQYPPIHVCLVIDRSTSMGGERMDMVKANISQFFKLLKPQDMISVVTFSDRAEVVIPPSRPSDLVRMENRINMIHIGGGTEILKGRAETGLTQLKVAKGMRMLRQLILLTDGHTYGDEQVCFEMATKAAYNGITINALGLGNEWNDAFLDRLTSLSGGNSAFVTSPKDLYNFLEQKLRSLTTIYARRINFEFQSTPGVELRYAFRINPDVGPIQTNSPIPVGDLLYGKSLVFLFEFLLPPLAKDLERIVLASGRLVMELPTKEGIDVRLAMKLSRAVTAHPAPELPPAPIIEAMSHLSLYRLQEKARLEVSTGNISQATRHLQYLATHLLSQGNRELAHDVLIEADLIQQSRQFSQDGEKRIKYGTRALLLPSGSEQIKVMILCPNCHHQEVAGALFCSECGAQLVSTQRVSTQVIRKNQSDILSSVMDPSSPPDQPVQTGPIDASVSLYLVDSGQILHLAGRTEFTIGRVADGQPILPDVDLSPYEAYTQGVSRLHSSLKIVNQRVVITDLGSSNGTRVNGQKIMPHIDYPLNHGDVIALGKLKVQVLIRR